MTLHPKSTEVLVIGDGITGLSAAWHLERAGIGKVILSTGSRGSPGSPVRATAGSPVTGRAAGLAMGGQVDNFTRVSHAHGAPFAADLWRFGDLAFDLTRDFCRSHGVGFVDGGRLRLIVADDELVEAQKAVAQLEAQGFPCRLLRPDGAERQRLGLSERVLAVQDEGGRGAWMDVRGLLAKLGDGIKAVRVPPVRMLESHSGRIEATLMDGTKIGCEMAIVAAHLGISKLVPSLADALISVADQWMPVSHDGARSGLLGPEGMVFSAHHTYEWGVTTREGLHLGGGRYLRPMAGIEATEALPEGRIVTHMLGQLQKTFPWARNAKAGKPVAALDCRPCDELPIIGPMYGESRLLVATGYMGSGLTEGFAAGRCLARLVAKGQAAELPRGLWPERLRTLGG